MIQLNNTISIQQVMKVIDNKTGQERYLTIDDNQNKWIEISQDEYNKIRGNKNEQ